MVKPKIRSMVFFNVFRITYIHITCLKAYGQGKQNIPIITKISRIKLAFSTRLHGPRNPYGSAGLGYSSLIKDCNAGSNNDGK